MDELELIQQQIAELQKKAEEVAQANRLPVLEDIKNKIKLYGFTAKELGFRNVGSDPSTPTKKPVRIKYKKGTDTWTGRGRQPKWVVEFLNGGGKLEDIAA